MQGKTLGEERVDRFRTEIKNIIMHSKLGAQQPLRPPPRCARAPREVYTPSLVGPTLSLSTSAAPRHRGGDAAPQRGRLARRGCRRRCAAQRRALAAPRTLPRMKSAHGCLAAVWGGRPLIKREEHSDWKLERRTGRVTCRARWSASPHQCSPTALGGSRGSKTQHQRNCKAKRDRFCGKRKMANGRWRDCCLPLAERHGFAYACLTLGAH